MMRSIPAVTRRQAKNRERVSLAVSGLCLPPPPVLKIDWMLSLIATGWCRPVGQHDDGDPFGQAPFDEGAEAGRVAWCHTRVLLLSVTMFQQNRRAAAFTHMSGCKGFSESPLGQGASV
jgi:hypothetical protein